MPPGVIAAETHIPAAPDHPADSAYIRAVGQLYALGQELAPLPPLPDGTPAPRRKWDLAYMRILCAALGDPQQTFPSVLIAGTNGKGSTAATLASILSAAGYKTGLYTSPHLVRVNERIQILPPAADVPGDSENVVILSEAKNPRILSEPSHLFGSQNLSSSISGSSSSSSALSSFAAGGGSASFPPSHKGMGAPHLDSEMWDVSTLVSTEIPDPTFARLFTQVEVTATNLVASGSLPNPPSFFEVLTALAFLYYAEENVDIAVLEVGLGGRLDATNIVEPLISVITDIALDHQDYLGDTIAAITLEKAGILRKDGILVTLPQHPAANQAIGEAAATLNLTAISAANFIPAQFRSADQRRGDEKAKENGFGKAA